MPSYDYRCAKCGMFEAHQSAGAVCPICGQPAERRYTPTAFSFGWRFTDQAHERFHNDRDEKTTVERDI